MNMHPLADIDSGAKYQYSLIGISIPDVKLSLGLATSLLLSHKLI